MNNDILEVLNKYWLKFLNLLPELFLSLLIMIMSYAAGKYISRFVRNKLISGTKDLLLSGLIGKIILWVCLTIGIGISMEVLGLASLASGIFAGAGISAVILGFAFKNIGENFISGILLAFNRPYKIGDVIESSGFKGTITSMDFRTTNIRTEERNIVYIPNSMILNNPLTNITKERIRRFDFTVSLDYSNDTDLAKVLISKALSGVPEIVKDPAPVIVLDQLSTAVQIKVYFWTDAFSTDRTMLEVKGEAIEKSKKELTEGGINFSDLTLIKITNDPVQLKLNT